MIPLRERQCYGSPRHLTLLWALLPGDQKMQSVSPFTHDTDAKTDLL